MNILVTGGAGYIGSHAVATLIGRGHQVSVLDDLSTGHAAAVDPRAHFVRGSTGDTEKVLALLRAQKIEGVMHFAASSQVGESVRDPYKYYVNNVANTLNFLGALKEARVNKLVFSSTAAVYGEPTQTPITEAEIPRPINPYGTSKLMVERILADAHAAYGLKYAVLRYFNVCGAMPDGSLGEDHEPESHLIPRLLQSCLAGTAHAEIYGTDYPTPDGTCIRDYVHVLDLVRAHELALEALDQAHEEDVATADKSASPHTYNLGSAHGFSVREVVSASARVTGQEFKITERPRRGGDPAILVASAQKITSRLGWTLRYPHLEDMIAHAWTWHQRQAKRPTT